MQRPALEVADIFRDFGSAWPEANRGHVSHAQLKVMHAILACRTAALGGFVARCENPECAHTVSRTAVVAIVPARSARAVKPLPGWGSARPSCCRFRISILFTLPAEIGA